ncbi:hypothetical protein BDU57DRAFT_515428 [Ampelomyces quisqualis]|uniref:Uncharacterized protein n=1 Tax=Ampelomyces quisqualis TaxID=50730 RepID=A0A6A5QT33_AMPQU|nr:hypothetical protein BDU57DRAFT_515428 [Ampelomyces quisqualis]
MSDQNTPAQPVPVATPQSNFSRPTTANHNAPVPNPTTPLAATTDEPRNLNSKLNTADRYWKFKGALQTVAILTGLIGLGTIGWCVSTTPMNDELTYGYNEYWTLWPSLITFSVSILWCAACILGLVVRTRPLHPGLRVATDLLLWLSFLVTALFAMVSLVEIRQWGQGGTLQSYGFASSSYGDYELAANGTWVWEQRRDSSSSTSTSYTRSCDAPASSLYDGFASCAEQDAHVNKLWQEKPRRQSVELTGVVCQFFGLVLHFALFAWACVDCHRYNRSKVSKDAEKIAATIVQTMITNGAIIPPPGQAQTGPVAPWGHQMGYYQLPQTGQAYPMLAMYPQGMQHAPPMPQQFHAPRGMAGPAAPGALGSSNNQGESPRYT